MAPILGYWDIRGLPYYIDGDVKLVQSEAILRYIAESHKMGGSDPAQRAKLAMINGSLNDVRRAYASTCYNPNFETLKVGLLQELPDRLKTFSEYLGSNEWFSGAQVDYPDFNAFEFFDALKKFAPGCLDAYANLVQFMNRFESLKNVKEYVASDKFKKSALNGRRAKWGNEPF